MPYTENITDAYFDAIERPEEAVWGELGRIWKEIQKDSWKKHYEDVVERYRVSARFAMMRVLLSIATGCPVEELKDEALTKGFSVGEVGTFADITVQHAEQLTEKELDQYKTLLKLRVEEFDPESLQDAIPMIERVLEKPKAGKKCELEREELLELGHYLDLSLDQMNFLLLRVLGDNEMGFHLSESDDLIEAFGYIRHLPLRDIVYMKDWYAQQSAAENDVKPAAVNVKKTDDFTRQITGEFEEIVKSWSEADDTEKMKKYLKQQMPMLDQPPLVALMIYRNLAAYAYYLYQSESYQCAGEISQSFYDNVDRMVPVKNRSDLAVRYLFEDGKISAEKCRKVAQNLMMNNCVAAGLTGTCANAHYQELGVDTEKGQAGIHGEWNAGNAHKNNRLLDILIGSIRPLKGDMLYLLWVAANFFWESGAADAEERADRMMDFLDAAKYVLSEAVLPGFYPPNALEDAMMHSITMADGDESPAEVYDRICASFTERGKSKKKAGKKNYSAEQKQEIVEYYKAHKKEGLTQIECAKEFGVSKASLTIWIREAKKNK